MDQLPDVRFRDTRLQLWMTSMGAKWTKGALISSPQFAQKPYQDAVLTKWTHWEGPFRSVTCAA
jgi:hypothetical protein